MTDQPGSIWMSLLGKRYLQDPAKVKLHAAKLQLLQSLPKTIYRGERDAILTRDELEPTLEPFRNYLAAQEYIFLVRFLARGLTKGRNKLGWKVAIPADLVTVPREPARFTPLTFMELKKLRRIEAVLVGTLKSTDLTPRLLLGRMLLAAIIYGGLLQSQWLMPMLTALTNRVRARGILIWLDLERIWQYPQEIQDENGESSKVKNKEIIINRRWFTDPLSRLLIIQWLRLPVAERTLREQLPNPYDLVKQFLRHAGCPPDDIPNSVNLLFAMAGTRIGLTVPPFLAAYAEGKINAVSLPASVWTRLCSRKSVPRQQLYSGRGEDEDAPVKQSWRSSAYAAAPVSAGEQRQFLKQLRRLVAKRGATKHNNAAVRKKLGELVSTHGDAMCQLLHILAAWMDFSLSPKKKNAPSSIERYLVAVADALLVVCGTNEILEWDAVEFQARYQQAFALIANQKKFARDTLGRFHRFLVKFYSAPYLATVFFAGRNGPAESTVDANLLSQQEFDLVKESLGWDNPDRPRSASAAIIAAILGFRCGLRREEVQYLRLRDIQGRHKPELVLRATPQRSLKSPSATRRLPLHVLLTKEELIFLKQWLNEFREPARNTLLLGIRGNNSLPLPDALLFRPISIAMRQVTGDDTLRYHHLRHSFATWLVLRLSGDYNSLHTAAPFFNHREFHYVRIQELRLGLLGNEQMGRKAAYAVSSLCGHADLDTTFTDYFHLCDWFLHRELSRPEGLPFLEAESLMVLTGRSRATVFRAMVVNETSGAKSWNWYSLLRNVDELLAIYKDPLLATVQERKAMEVSFPDEPAEVLWWESVQRALKMHQLMKKTIDNIGTQLGCDENTVQTWLDRAAWLGSLRGRVCGTTGRYYRHIELAREDSINLPAGIKRIRKNRIRKQVRIGVFPQPPHITADRVISLKMLNAFDHLDDSERSAVMLMVRTFVVKFCLLSGMIYFRDPARATEFVKSIRLLGIRNKNIQLIDCRNNLQGDSVVKRRRAYWEKELALKKSAWKVNHKAWGTESGTGTIGVQVVCELNGQKRASYGFRYALYMLAIAHWEYGQESI